MRSVSIFLAIAVITGCNTRQQVYIDTDYIRALSTANLFMESWRHRRQDEAFALLSDRLRNSRTEDEWRMAISGASNPHHQAYEISNGRPLPDGRIQFDVRLFDHYTDMYREDIPLHAPEQIILIGNSDTGWIVDGIPHL